MGLDWADMKGKIRIVIVQSKGHFVIPGHRAPFSFFMVSVLPDWKLQSNASTRR